MKKKKQHRCAVALEKNRFVHKSRQQVVEVVAEPPPDSPAGHKLEKPLTGPGRDPGLLQWPPHLICSVMFYRLSPQTTRRSCAAAAHHHGNQSGSKRIQATEPRSKRASVFAYRESCVVFLIFANLKLA